MKTKLMEMKKFNKLEKKNEKKLKHTTSQPQLHDGLEI